MWELMVEDCVMLPEKLLISKKRLSPLSLSPAMILAVHIIRILWQVCCETSLPHLLCRQTKSLSNTSLETSFLDQSFRKF